MLKGTIGTARQWAEEEYGRRSDKARVREGDTQHISREWRGGRLKQKGRNREEAQTQRHCLMMNDTPLCLQEVDELVEEDDGDDEGAEDTEAHRDIRTGNDVDAGEEGGKDGLKAVDIDAYWLQREISKDFAGIDADAAQKLSEEVFAKLEAGSDQVGHGCGWFVCLIHDLKFAMSILCAAGL